MQRRKCKKFRIRWLFARCLILVKMSSKLKLSLTLIRFTSWTLMKSCQAKSASPVLNLTHLQAGKWICRWWTLLLTPQDRMVAIAQGWWFSLRITVMRAPWERTRLSISTYHPHTEVKTRTEAATLPLMWNHVTLERAHRRKLSAEPSEIDKKSKNGRMTYSKSLKLLEWSQTLPSCRRDQWLQMQTPRSHVPKHQTSWIFELKFAFYPCRT